MVFRGTARLPGLLMLSALSLLAYVPAAAQDEALERGEIISDEEIPADIEVEASADGRQRVTCDWAGFALTLPRGGDFKSAEELLGQSAEADRMRYPLIWQADPPGEYERAPRFEMLMCGVYQPGHSITETDFRLILSDNHTALMREFPDVLSESQDLDIGGTVWNHIELANSASGLVSHCYCRYSGGTYYSLSFPALLTADRAGLMQAAGEVLMSFTLLEAARGAP